MVEVQLRQLEKKNKSHAGLEFVRENVIIEVQPAADQKHFCSRMDNKILPVIYFANLEESSFTNSF